MSGTDNFNPLLTGTSTVVGLCLHASTGACLLSLEHSVQLTSIAMRGEKLDSSSMFTSCDVCASLLRRRLEQNSQHEAQLRMLSLRVCHEQRIRLYRG